ncbi:nuclear pore glycoprotein p62 [Ophiostoma piceae UAMH 11346]|uniref:Nucleoporin NSP1 n=1 Tax=Ophiostoma piceae (strain UAMH 11346) TaxID=1262450 RepID=S3CCB4_OPHP1|nr:nuclear pore glycoprotein p62 [Ophiostoma piceae UAMH 11346]
MAFNFTAPSTSAGSSTPTTAAPSLFGGAGAAGGAPSFSFAKPGATPAAGSAAPSAGGGLFSGLGGSSTPGAAKPLFGGAPSTTGGLFGSGGAAAAPASTGAGGGFSFGNAGAAAPATSAATTKSLFGVAPAATASGSTTPSFGGFGTTSAAAPAATTTASSGGGLFPAATPAKPLFAGLGSTTPAGAPPTTAKPATGGLFGGASAAPATTTAAAPSGGLFGGAASYDYCGCPKHKEFQGQASRVKEWDQKLVENGEKIQKLYLETYEAERASNEIDRQLQSVESQQDELAAWLDRYEREAEELMSRQSGPGEQLTGPDQERERTYKLAERLIDRMDDMSKDMTKMIKEINDISGSLSKTGKTDDPLSQIVRVLNGHLSQLQWIDTNAAALQTKVASAKKAEGGLGGAHGGLESDAADSFYRSYMGRR